MTGNAKPYAIRPVPIDADLEAGLARAPSVRPVVGESAIDAERRRRHDVHVARRGPLGVEAVDTTWGGVAAREYRAAGERSGWMIWLHGGAWMYGEPEGDDAMCARFATEAGVRVVAPDYRLAPEHPYPAALDDTRAVLDAVLADAGGLPVIVGGASAGATLAAGATISRRDVGGTQPAAQLLICPALDHLSGDEDSGPLNRRTMTEYWSRYLRGRPADEYAAPGRAADLGGLPKTYIFTTSSDPLRLEGWRWALGLVAAGVDAEARFIPGGYHGFEYEVPDSGFSRRAVDEWIAVIRKTVGAESRVAGG